MLRGLLSYITLVNIYETFLLGYKFIYIFEAMSIYAHDIWYLSKCVLTISIDSLCHSQNPCPHWSYLLDIWILATTNPYKQGTKLNKLRKGRPCPVETLAHIFGLY